MSENKNASPAQLTVIVGSMFSSKSTTLLAQRQRHSIAKRKCLLIKYEEDKRYSKDKKVTTHDKRAEEADVECKELRKIDKQVIENADVIFVDEGQFFPDLIETVQDWVNHLGKMVYVAGLDMTWEGKPFRPMSDLMAMAEKRIHLKAVCVKCGKDAHFTKRLVTCKTETLIGGSESYEARCRMCFLIKDKDPEKKLVKSAEVDDLLKEMAFRDLTKSNI